MNNLNTHKNIEWCVFIENIAPFKKQKFQKVRVTNL